MDKNLVVEPKDVARIDDQAPRSVELSVVVPISERPDDLREIYRDYSRVLSGTGKAYEFIFVLDGPNAKVRAQLECLREEHTEIRVIRLNRWFGEATALSVGFDSAKGATILALPSYFQVEPPEILKLIGVLEKKRGDLVTAWRHPRIDSPFNRLQSWGFHRITRLLTGTRFHDISCGVRVMRRKVADEVQLYGDLHRFFPLLAYRQGFKVVEVPVRQSPRDSGRRIYGPGVYLRRLLDILTLFFIFKFTKRPLRFFGLVGSGLFGTGSIITGYLGLYRVLGYGAIGNRPLLILGVLLIVLGIQLFSIGLLGEIIIFTHAGQIKDYEIEEIEE